MILIRMILDYQRLSSLKTPDSSTSSQVLVQMFPLKKVFP